MKRLTVITSLLGLLVATPVMADKPTWAGQDGKPSEAEREMHKDAMRAKSGAKNKEKHIKDKGSRDMDERMEHEHERREYREGHADSKQDAERMKQQSPAENVHEAIHDAEQAHDTAQKVKKWYEFWKN